jgi:hypothetical protein
MSAGSLRLNLVYPAHCLSLHLQERVAKILGGANILPAKLQYRSRPPKKAEGAA